jgi:catechol 2,3-dioxygenase-like lactoylglutathione lyase family enzyme
MRPPTIAGISHLIIEVSDLERSRRFYELLGFGDAALESWPDCNESTTLSTASGQHLVLSLSGDPASLPETGVHQAYRVGADRREKIAAKLQAQAVEIHDYKEDRPAEAPDNLYFHDPDGNRVQLVASDDAPEGVQAIDHAAVEVVDIEWAEDFYANLLGLPVDCRVGWRTEDYLRAKLWGEGKEAMAPGTRRWDKRYTVMEQKRLLPRPNTHFFVRAGDAVIGVYLATQHRQEPREEQPAGTPRIALRTDAEGMEIVASALNKRGTVAAGPKKHSAAAPIASSLYFKDPGGNFVELCVTR